MSQTGLRTQFKYTIVFNIRVNGVGEWQLTRISSSPTKSSIASSEINYIKRESQQKKLKRKYKKTELKNIEFQLIKRNSKGVVCPTIFEETISANILASYFQVQI